MLHMFAALETTLAQCNVLAIHTFVHHLTRLDFFQLTTVTVIVVLFAFVYYFFSDLLFLVLDDLQTDLFYY